MPVYSDLRAEYEKVMQSLRQQRLTVLKRRERAREEWTALEKRLDALDRQIADLTEEGLTPKELHDLARLPYRDD